LNIMQPFVIAVAPNGARRTKADHPALPMTPVELIETAHRCAEAGASMMHFHVRDAKGRHSLDPELYRRTLTLLEKEAGDRLLFQISSEAAGVYAAAEQVRAMEQLAPRCLSIGLREIFRAPEDYEPGHRFLNKLHLDGALIQYILYSPEEVFWYDKLCAAGIVPGDYHLLLFVLGSYAAPDVIPYPLGEYTKCLKRPATWMACGFGRIEAEIARQAAELGGHVRVGFENNLLLPDATTAPDNGALVAAAALAGNRVGRALGAREQALALYHNEVAP
jgi:3-keto-5-aminohexanoate cleavage enzyme